MMSFRKSKMRTRQKNGFTLIELMVVVVIVSILASIAYPSYLNSVMKSRRADAKSALLQNAQFMERTYTANNTYQPGGAAPTLPITATPVDTATKYYDIALDNTLSDTTFRLTATPKSGTSQANDTCGTLAVTNTGAKYQTDGATTATSTCW